MKKRFICIALATMTVLMTACGSTDYSAYIDSYELWGQEDEGNYWYIYLNEDAKWSEKGNLKNNTALALYAIRERVAKEENENAEAIFILCCDYNGDNAFAWNSEYGAEDEMIYYLNGKEVSTHELDDDQIDYIYGEE